MSTNRKMQGVTVLSGDRYCFLLRREKYGKRWVLIYLSSSSLLKTVHTGGNPASQFVRLHKKDAGKNEKEFWNICPQRVIGVIWNRGDTRENFFTRCLAFARDVEVRR